MSKVNFELEYEVNPSTMAILPFYYEGALCSKVYERGGDISYVPHPNLTLIESACDYFGVPYEGRRAGCKHLINAQYKSPIAIEPYLSMYAFPTLSPTKPECIWIFDHHIRDYRKQEGKSVMLIFHDNQSIEIPISYASFENQFSRTAKLRIRYEQNVNMVEHYQSRKSKRKYWKASEFPNFYRVDE